MGYCLPPREIVDIVDAPPLPVLSILPKKDKILFLKRRDLPSLEDIAGLRIDGRSNTLSHLSFYTRTSIHSLSEDGKLGLGKEVRGFPDGAKINFVHCIPRTTSMTMDSDKQETEELSRAQKISKIYNISKL